MPLDLFRTSHIRYLRSSIGTNLARYSEPRAWADRKPGTDPIRLPSALEPAAPLKLELPVDRDLKDLENAKIVHRAFPNLTPLQARPAALDPADARRVLGLHAEALGCHSPDRG